VGGIEAVAVPLIGKHGDAAVVLVTDHAAVAVFARELPALVIESVPIAVAGRVAEHAGVAVLIEPSHLAVVGDVAPNQITALPAPRRALGPQHAGAQPLNGSV